MGNGWYCCGLSLLSLHGLFFGYRGIFRCITWFQTQPIPTTCQIRYHSHLWGHRSTGQLRTLTPSLERHTGSRLRQPILVWAEDFFCGLSENFADFDRMIQWHASQLYPGRIPQESRQAWTGRRVHPGRRGGGESLVLHALYGRTEGVVIELATEHMLPLGRIARCARAACTCTLCTKSLQDYTKVGR